MHEIIDVQLRSAGEVKSFLTGGMKFDVGEKVIVEADRGLDYGAVVSQPEKVIDISSVEQPLRKIIRKVNPWDEKQIQKNKTKTNDLMKICDQKIDERRLKMKLIDAEYSFDRSKIIFYFTAETRVDFRELVKDLASIFRVRIELKLCCISFLKDFNPVTIKMAKTQQLALNPSKISGLCGRLMCCLGYESKCYKELLKDMPKEGQEIKTEHGKGKVLEVHPLKGTVTVDLGEGKIKEVKVEKKKEEKV